VLVKELGSVFRVCIYNVVLLGGAMATKWVDSPLLKAAKEGSLCVIEGLSGSRVDLAPLFARLLE
jgi:hypothetical protein